MNQYDRFRYLISRLRDVVSSANQTWQANLTVAKFRIGSELQLSLLTF